MSNQIIAKFQDDEWEDASSYHDGSLVSVGFDISTLSLTISIHYNDNLYREDEPGWYLVTYRFLEVDSVAFDGVLAAEPRCALIDRLNISASANREAASFCIDGMYAWHLRWQAKDFTKQRLVSDSHRSAIRE